MQLLNGLDIFLGLLIALACLKPSSQCTLVRDLIDCPADTYVEELFCMMRQNSLFSLAGCITIDEYKKDHQYCRYDDGIEGNGNDRYYKHLPPGVRKGKNDLCMAPRDVLIEGSLHKDCRECSMAGILDLCPEDDPDFLDCLCEHLIFDEHLECLSNCFRGDSRFRGCKRRMHERRGEDSDHHGFESPPQEVMQSMKRSLQVRRHVFFQARLFTSSLNKTTN